MARKKGDPFLYRGRKLCRDHRPLLFGLLFGIAFAVTAIVLTA